MVKGAASPAKSMLVGNGAGKVWEEFLKLGSGLFSEITVDWVRNAIRRIPSNRIMKVVMAFFMGLN
jgi:hypothetical protein